MFNRNGAGSVSEGAAGAGEGLEEVGRVIFAGVLAELLASARPWKEERPVISMMYVPFSFPLPSSYLSRTNSPPETRPIEHPHHQHGRDPESTFAVYSPSTH